jgi:hypothetical protein
MYMMSCQRLLCDTHISYVIFYTILTYGRIIIYRKTPENGKQISKSKVFCHYDIKKYNPINWNMHMTMNNRENQEHNM